MTLRTVHLIFILLVIVTAELFGARQIWTWRHTQDALTLAMGILSLAGGLGLSFYSLAFVRKMDAAGIT